MKKFFKTIFTIFIFIIVLIVIVSLVGFFLYPKLGNAIKNYARIVAQHVQTSCVIPIPSEWGQLILLRNGVDPSIAPFAYKLKLIDGAMISEKSAPFFGGRDLRVNIYWYPDYQEDGPWVRFEDGKGEYLLNIKDQRINRILRYESRLFMGDFSGNPEDIGIVESAGKMRVSVGRNILNEVEGTPMNESQGIYLGRIEGIPYKMLFVSLGQSPEEKFGH